MFVFSRLSADRREYEPLALAKSIAKKNLEFFLKTPINLRETIRFVVVGFELENEDIFIDSILGNYVNIDTGDGSKFIREESVKILESLPSMKLHFVNFTNKTLSRNSKKLVHRYMEYFTRFEEFEFTRNIELSVSIQFDKLCPKESLESLISCLSTFSYVESNVSEAMTEGRKYLHLEENTIYIRNLLSERLTGKKEPLSLRCICFAFVILSTLVALYLAEYNENEAYQALGYSAIANCPNADVIRSWECRFCTGGVFPAPQPEPLEPRSRRVLTSVENELGLAVLGVDTNAQRVVVAFQGTTNAEQTINNLDIIHHQLPELCDGCAIATGWWDVWESFQGSIVGNITELAAEFEVNQVFLTGHSLGGALATVTAALLQVGNQAFVEYYLAGVSESYRVVNYHDPIPSLLPVLGDAYRHIPQEIWYNVEPEEGQELAPNSYTLLSESNGEDPDGQNSRCEFLNVFKWCTDGSNHEIYLNSYVFTGEANC
eukprot:augustus_masked-scaffold_33-processed-gene-3.53-mRNA-1 protein AED:1.00 eAED:1.00 QI:0/0/0/0/1/1/3/0/489